MMKQHIIAFLIFSFWGFQGVKAQKIIVNREVQSPKYGTLLLGHQTADQFDKEPFNQWFKRVYDDYQPNEEVIKKIKKEKLSSIKIVIFMATWSEQCQQEFPKIMKILDAVKYPKNKLQIIALNSKNESPTGDETLFNIQKTLTIVLKKYGKQLGRLEEAPQSESWEQDFLNILNN